MIWPKADASYPLHYSIQTKNFRNTEILLDNGASVFYLDKDKRLPLDHLKDIKTDYMPEKKKRNLEKLKNIITSKMALHGVFGSNHVPFLSNSISGFLQNSFKRFISNCINGKPLDEEMKDMDKDAFQELTRNNFQDLKTGFRAIDFAAFQGHTKIVEKLLQYGANPEVLSIENEIVHSAIDIAISRKHQDVVNCLFEHGVKAENQIFLALKKDNLDVARYLLTFNKVRPDAVDTIDKKLKINALHLACQLGKHDFVEIMVNNGAHINARCLNNEQSPLHFAAINCHFKVVECLVNNFADVFQRDKDKRTALDSVKQSATDSESKDVIIEYLESIMADAKNISRSRKRRIENPDESVDSSIPLSKSRKIMKDQCTSTDEMVNDEQQMPSSTQSIEKAFADTSTSTDDIGGNECRNQQSKSSDGIKSIVQSLKDLFLKNNPSYSRKIMCLSAIEVIISEDPDARNQIAEKKVIDEIANLVTETVSKGEHNQNKDLGIIAKILTKLKSTNEGKKLIGEMKLSFDTFEKLREEMKKFEVQLDPSHFAFDSCTKLKFEK